MSLQGPLKREVRESESEMEEAELLAVKMEEGAMSQGYGASKTLEKAGNGSP